MPVWLRTFTFNSLKEHFDKIKEKQDERNNVMTNQPTSKKEIARPNIAPKTAYTTTNKAPNP
jgi:hypothetical protein